MQTPVRALNFVFDHRCKSRSSCVQRSQLALIVVPAILDRLGQVPRDRIDWVSTTLLLTDIVNKARSLIVPPVAAVHETNEVCECDFVTATDHQEALPGLGLILEITKVEHLVVCLADFTTTLTTWTSERDYLDRVLPIGFCPIGLRLSTVVSIIGVLLVPWTFLGCTAPGCLALVCT